MSSPTPQILRPSYRLAISVPELEMYSVDGIVNLIAAAQHPCERNDYCGRCDTYNAYRRRFDPVTPKCEEIVLRRECCMANLCRQLSKQIAGLQLQAWRKDRSEVLDPPEIRASEAPDFRKWKWWTKLSYLFPDDLASFCAFEKIKLCIIDYSKPGTDDAIVSKSSASDTSGTQNANQSWVLKANEPDKSDSSTESFQEKCETPCMGSKQHPIISPDLDASTRPPAIEVKRRFDKIGAEIHEILTESPALTPTQVMTILIGRAGTQNSCVVANDGSSIRWENARDKKITLDQNMLNDRVRRWRSTHGAAPFNTSD